MIQFKNRADEPKYADLDFRVKFFVEWFHSYSSLHNCPCVLVTDIDTPGVHQENGPHYRKQAIDLSIRSLGLARAEAFSQEVNRIFDYGRGFKVALCGTEDPHGKHNDHLHIQVPGPYRASGKIPLW